ncbi:GPP34 family phosphoprotein [Saccharopolyspora erythraea]|uniref:GPP34 family phosphoprotein n=1 Tax=Saccharopolyspora erythraea TaxID=1836 RepID=UPI001BA84E47|nr:GPP34 family phosphoprotein [Saccharopolyspora erythraea]QUG99553.1 GPP34 family phosphoprotein [Saccharopolyspora erythraea]
MHPSHPLALPEEFLLLAHRESGKVRESARVAAGCAAAELGDLALRGRLLVRVGHASLLSSRLFWPEPTEIELLAVESTGLAWADNVLAELLQWIEAGPVSLNRWVRRHKGAFQYHRAALVGRGLLRPGPGTGLSRLLGRQHHYPDQALRHRLIAELRATTTGRRVLDERLLFLSDLMAAVGLHDELGIGKWGFPHRMNPDRGIGVVTFRPEAMRDTSYALASAVPPASSGDGGLVGDSGGGDGGGGGGD